MFLLGCTLAVAALLLGGSAAHAETVQYVALAQSVDQVLSNIRTWITGILAGVALVFLTIGGLRYLMGANDPGEIEKAKGAFKASGIGFGLAALAPLVVFVLQWAEGRLPPSPYSLGTAGLYGGFAVAAALARGQAIKA